MTARPLYVVASERVLATMAGKSELLLVGAGVAGLAWILGYQFASGFFWAALAVVCVPRWAAGFLIGWWEARQRIN